jgi:hypothetical protein
MSTTPAAPSAQPTAARAGLRALWGPIAVGIGAVVAAVWVWARDPSTSGGFLSCPFHAVTGLDCPGCGTTRGMHDLLHGDVAAALDHNLLLLVAVPLAAATYVAWVRRSWTGGGTRLVLSRGVLVAVVVLGVTFWVVRNLPGVPFLPAA